jgi:hypothetical protein
VSGEAQPVSPRERGDGALREGALDRAARAFERWDRALYLAFTAACVGYTATLFYGYLHTQTGGTWSAPLDDVFIHFDYARATARGHPFEWSEGNGFSSGNTSVLYPFVLALGYAAGLRDLSLMAFAAAVACLSVLSFLSAAGRLFDPLGRWAKYVLPPAVLSLGALDWSLWSGMENALHLGVWGLLLLALLALPRAPSAPRAWAVGVAGALLVATRPESVVCVAAAACLGGLEVARRRGLRAGAGAFLAASFPGALFACAQAAANRAFTGEWSANGAIAKLALNNPYMTGEQKWDEYLFHLKYVIVRNTQHHFSDVEPWGWLVPIVALVPLAVRRLRPTAIFLWAQVVGWSLLVALNGQVRWQNERYTMAAVAWLFVLWALGLAALLSRVALPGRRAGWLARAAAAVALAAVYWVHQAPNMRDQIWFFGRASRNILDQHVRAGRFLAELGPRRVLVGDAGALMYASDLPGLDLIGLGGYHDYPFARAGVHGLGASLELVERLSPEERPDVMALYPTWWGELPAIFGARLRGFPIAGNVICGGAEKVIYRADWSPLERLARPRELRPGERVVDELDVADLVSEAAHRYSFPSPGAGYVTYRVLAEPGAPGRDLFDAGRLVPEGRREAARLAAGAGRARLVLRTAPARAVDVDVIVDGASIGPLHVPEARGWVEVSIDLPRAVASSFELALVPTSGELWSYHMWVVSDAP